MAPPYLSGNVYHDQDAAVVDVQTIIDNFVTMALAAMPAWTNPGVGQLVSPPDSSGRSFSLQFTRIAATNLQILFTDGLGRTLTRRCQIPASATVNYYIGQFHILADWINGANLEGFFAIMLDESPENQTSHDRWLICNTSRTTADTVDGIWRTGNCFGIRSGGVFASLDRSCLFPAYFNGTNGITNGNMCRTLGGSNVWYPFIQMGDSTAGIYNIFGKWYQCLICKDSFIAVDSEVSVPIDQANSAIFRVTTIPSLVPAGADFHDRTAVRKT